MRTDLAKPPVRSVLIVEDDRSARTAIARLLAKRGFAVSEAGSVAQAVSALDEQPHWILLDLMLPDGNGTSVLRKVRADRLASRVCIVTGCCDDMLRDAQRTGAEHTFIKPLDVERLLSVLSH